MNAEAIVPVIAVTAGWILVSENPHPIQKYLLLTLLLLHIAFSIQEWLFPGGIPIHL